MLDAFSSWGRYPRVTRQEIKVPAWRTDPLPAAAGSLLPYGLGRSYGDCCLNEGGTLLHTRRLDHLIAFDPEAGIIECESGVTLPQLLDFIVPRGWFLPVTPGTKFVTIGGAIANDVHGKNHHRDGTFGRHVLSLDLLRSDGSKLTCSPDENADLFRSTVAGIGLTGLILSARIRLKRISSALIDFETIRFGNLDEFLDLSSESDAEWDYSVAWADGLAAGSNLGRGHFMRGNHAESGPLRSGPTKPLLSVPLDLPDALLNPFTVRLFNSAYYWKHPARRSRRTVHYDPFFYPLDALEGWNRVYGRRGFLQYQSVIPRESGAEPVRDLLRAVAAGGSGSFLTVLKTCGDLPSPGRISFPRPGVTAAFDIPFLGRATLDLGRRLDAITRAAGGRVYAAKDAATTPECFGAFYPDWRSFARHIDPNFSSSFWRRVTRSLS